MNGFDRQNPQDPYRSPLATDSAFIAQKTSALSLLSLISGVMSFPMMCLCFMSIPFSLFAIVAGHMSRGVIRDTQGAYRGFEMGTLGMLLGYLSLFIMGVMLLLGTAWKDTARPVVVRPKNTPAVRPSSAEAVLLEQAERQLLASAEPATFANGSHDGRAIALAKHFAESLTTVDQSLFAETSSELTAETRSYRVFVQLNNDSCAILLSVASLDRFTDSARETLRQVAWLTAQRSLDDQIPVGSRLAVALYSADSLQTVMRGVTRRGSEFDAGLKNTESGSRRLAEFFRLPQRPQKPAQKSTDRVKSKIDNNPAIGELP